MILDCNSRGVIFTKAYKINLIIIALKAISLFSLKPYNIIYIIGINIRPNVAENDKIFINL